MDFLILAGVAIVSFIWGWNTRERVAIIQSNKLLKQLSEEVEEQQENVIRIKIEKHEGVLYAYHYDNSLFIAQADCKEDLEKKLSEKFPGKTFGCSSDNLKDIGFVK